MEFETLYADFTANVLPKIQEGLVITKDYAFDLFGRYIIFLTVMDVVYLIIGVIGICLWIKYTKKLWMWAKDRQEKDYSDGVEYIVPIALVFITIFPLSLSVKSVENLAKDVFIPEIRVYEEINEWRNGNKNR